MIIKIIRRNIIFCLVIILIYTFCYLTFGSFLQYIFFICPYSFKLKAIMLVGFMSFICLLDLLSNYLFGFVLSDSRSFSYSQWIKNLETISNEYFIKNGSSGFSDKIKEYVQACEWLLNDSFMNFIPGVIYSILIALIFIIRDPIAGSMLVGWFLVIGVFYYIVNKKIKNYQNNLFLEQQDCNKFVQDISNNYMINRIFNIYSTLDLQLQEKAKNINKYHKKQWILYGIFNGGYKIISGLLFCSAIYSFSHLPIARASLFYSNVITMFWIVLFRLQVLGHIQREFRRIKTIEKEFEKITETYSISFARKISPKEFNGSIEISELKHFPLSINYLYIAPGEHVILKGESGSGKTSLVNLLTNQIRPQSGSIKIGSQPLATWSNEIFWNNVGYVTQVPLLYDGTIRYNLRLINDSLTDEYILELMDRVRLAKTPDDPVISLSLGQKQRLNIARILLKTPTILFCDEITASLDKRNREIIRSIIFTQFSSSTIIMIDHNYEEISPGNVKIVDINGFNML